MDLKILLFLWIGLLVRTSEQVTTIGSSLDDIRPLVDGGAYWTVPGDGNSSPIEIRWQPVANGGRMRFTITGNDTGYVAMAISTDEAMGVADDCYICSRINPTSDTVQVRSAHLVGETEPVYDAVVDPADVEATNLENGTMTCTFLRDISLTKLVSGVETTWNLSSEAFNLLYAQGPVLANGNIVQHTHRKHTNSAFRLITSTEDDIAALVGGGGTWFVPGGKLITWQPFVLLGVEWIKFTIVGDATGYVAMAISVDENMSDDDAYICSRESPSSSTVVTQSAYLTGHAPPTIIEPVAHPEFVDITDGIMTCVFLRAPNVTKTVGGQTTNWDLTTRNFNLLYAEGEVAATGAIMRHTHRQHTHGQFSLTDNSMFSRTINPTPNVEDDVAALIGGGGTWFVPSGKLITWQPFVLLGSEWVKFTIVGDATGYVAMAISVDEDMSDDDCYICSRESPSSSTIVTQSAYITSRVAPFIFGPHDRPEFVDVTDGIMTCVFLRALNATKTLNGQSTNWDLTSGAFNLLYAEGAVTAGGAIVQHTHRKHTHGPFSLDDNSLYTRRINPTPNVEDDIAALVGGGGTWFVPGGKQVTWQPFSLLGVDWMKITVVGDATGYVAVAFSVDEDMSDDDCYICSRQSPSSSTVVTSSAYISTRVAPLIIGRHSQAQFADVTDGIMTCVFLRALHVTRTVQGQTTSWDLPVRPFNLLYAEGEVNVLGAITQHTHRKHTHGPFSLTDNSLYRRRINPTPSIEDQIVAMPNSGAGQWLLADGRSITWEVVLHEEVEKMRFLIIGKGSGYVAMAISVDEDMSNDDCYICSLESPTSSNILIQSAYLTTREAPTIVGPVDSKLIVGADLTNGTFACAFLRPLSVTKVIGGISRTWNLTSDAFNLLYAEGEVNSGGNIVRHTVRKHTHGPFSLVDNTLYLQTGFSTISPPTTSSAQPKQRATGMFSTILIVTMAIMTSL